MIRVRGAHQLPQRIGERFRALARAGHHEDIGGVSIVVRHVNRTLPLRFRELRLFYRADDADNGEQQSVV